MEKIIVSGVKRFDFKDQVGKQIKGEKIEYMMEVPQDDGSKKGIFCMEVAVPEGTYDKLKCPCVAEMDYVFLPDGKGQAKMHVKEIKFIKEVRFPFNVA